MAINKHPENVKDNFYIENNICLTCGASKAEATETKSIGQKIIS